MFAFKSHIMIKKILLLLFVCATSQLFAAQYVGFKWAKSMGGNSDDYATGIATDAQRNIYTVGEFKGTVDFNPSPSGVFNLTAYANFDFFILKTDSSGNFIWAKKIGGPADDNVNSIFVDTSGFIYMTGFFSGTVNFNPNGVANLTTSGLADHDIFVTKFDTAGNFIWAKQIGGTQSDYGYSVVMDAFNHLLIAGSFRGTVDFNPNTGISNLSSAGNYDIFVEKLDTAGNFIWAKNMGGPGIDYAFSLATDVSGNVYATGTFSGTSDFDPGIPVYNLMVTGSASDEDIFISKLDSAGNFVWAKNIGGLNYDIGASIAVNASGVYTTGYFWGTADFDPSTSIYNLTALGTNDIFISKLDTAGNFKWAKRFGSAGYNQGTSLVTDTIGSVYTTGTFNGVTDFDPGVGTYNLTSAGSTDGFILKLDSAGNFVWGKAIGGTSDDAANSLFIDKDQNIYTAGSFSNTADFDPGSAVFNLTSFNTNADIFIQKMGSCQPSYSTLSITSCDAYTLNAQTYTLSDVYTQVNENATGCDSVITLNLIINYSSMLNVNQSACDSYLFNSQTYTTSGVYTQTYINAAGCDSLVSLSLNISYSSNASINQTSCNSYSLNGQTYTTSGTFTQSMTNVSGCDSTLTLNLIIHTSSTSVLTQTACNNFALNAQIYSASGVYTQVFTNAGGCDSTLTLNLTINSVNATVTQSSATLTANAIGANYQWVNCPSYSLITGATNQSYTALTNGSYAAIVTQNSCTDTSSCYAVSSLDMDDYLLADDIKISPNPTNGFLHITCNGSLSNASIKIVNILGETVLQYEKLKGKNFTFDISNQTMGLYFLEIIEEEKTVRMKIIKK